MAKVALVAEEVSEVLHTIFIEVLHVDVLGDQTGQGVDDRAITNFLLVLRAL